MAFSYLGTLATDRDKVRFYLGDTTRSAGPLPADANFTDAEIDGLISAEGNWQRAVAAGFERLAASWRKYPSFTADGLQLARSDIAKGFDEQAQTWRKQYGTSTTARTGVAGSRAPTRVDGYSDDIDGFTR